MYLISEFEYKIGLFYIVLLTSIFSCNIEPKKIKILSNKNYSIVLCNFEGSDSIRYDIQKRTGTVIRAIVSDTLRCYVDFLVHGSFNSETQRLKDSTVLFNLILNFIDTSKLPFLSKTIEATQLRFYSEPDSNNLGGGFRDAWLVYEYLVCVNYKFGRPECIYLNSSPSPVFFFINKDSNRGKKNNYILKKEISDESKTEKVKFRLY